MPRLVQHAAIGPQRGRRGDGRQLAEVAAAVFGDDSVGNVAGCVFRDFAHGRDIAIFIAFGLDAVELRHPARMVHQPVAADGRGLAVGHKGNGIGAKVKQLAALAQDMQHRIRRVHPHAPAQLNPCRLAAQLIAHPPMPV